MENIVRYFRGILLSMIDDENPEITEFITSMRFKTKDIHRLELGYIPKDYGLPAFVAVRHQYYKDIGILSEDGVWIMQERVISPNRNMDGDIIALSGRLILEDVNRPKYLSICNIQYDSKEKVAELNDITISDLNLEIDGIYESELNKNGIEAAEALYLYLLKKHIKTFADAGYFIYCLCNRQISHHRFSEYAIAYWWLHWYKKTSGVNPSDDFFYADLLPDFAGVNLSHELRKARIPIRGKSGKIKHELKMIDFYKTFIEKTHNYYVKAEVSWSEKK